MKCFIGSAAFSTVADLLFSTLLAWYIADVWQSGTLMGTMMLVLGTMRIVVSFVSGVVVDRYGPKRLLIAADVARGFIIVALVLSLVTVQSEAVLFLVCLFGAIDAFHWPAIDAMKSRVFPQEQTVKWNGLYFTLLRGANLSSPLLAVYLLQVTSYTIAFTVIAVLFIVSALLVSFVHVHYERAGVERRKWKEELMEGYRYIFAHGQLKYFISLIALVNLCANGIFVMLPYLVKAVGLSVTALGTFSTAVGIGTISAGVFVTMTKKVTPSLSLIAFMFIGQGTAIALVPIFANIWWMSAAFLLFGITTAVSSIVISSFMQLNVPSDKMGRVGGLMMTLSMSTTPIAQFMFGALVDWLSADRLFYVAGLYEAIVAMLILWLVKVNVKEASRSL